MPHPTKLQIRDREYQVVYKKATRRTSSVRIRQDQVIISLSRFAIGRERDRMVAKFIQWATKKLQNSDQSDFVLPKYQDGGRICTHNKVYEIRATREPNRQKAKSNLEGGQITIHLPPNAPDSKIKDICQKLIIQDQTPYLQEVIHELNQLHFQTSYNQVRWKRIKSRFGSCSSTGNITIAYNLLFAPREVFRYVCIHELAHLLEFNHSKRFWNLVGEAMPDYKLHEKWLKKKGFLLG